MSARPINEPPDGVLGASRSIWIERHGTPWQRCFQDLYEEARWGVSTRSAYRVLAPLHIIVQGPDGPVMWCTSGKAIEGKVHPAQRECPACMALLREQADEYQDSYE